MAVSFAHPFAALVALAGVVPIAITGMRLRDAHGARRALGLPEPRLLGLLVRPLALVCLFGLLGLAAARPSLSLQSDRTVRPGVQVIVALDGSRSMLAAQAPGKPQRWQRAVAFAQRLRDALPGVPMGISSFTNRLLPYLFPTSDVGTYDLVLEQSYGIERPPPSLTIDKWVTTFDPLNEVSVRQFFSPDVHRRVLVVLSDAETRSFSAASIRQHLRRTGTTPVVVRFWQPRERIFDGKSTTYLATQPDVLGGLRRAGWPAFGERDLGAALARIKRAVGTGPVVHVGYARSETPLAPWLALTGLLPLLLLVAPAAPRPSRTRHELSSPAAN
jgi:hypothetical protein